MSKEVKTSLVLCRIHASSSVQKISEDIMLRELYESDASEAVRAEAARLTPEGKSVSAATIRTWAKKAGFQVVAKEGEQSVLLIVQWHGKHAETLAVDTESLTTKWSIALRDDLLFEATPTFVSSSRSSWSDRDQEMITKLLRAGGIVPQILAPQVPIESDLQSTSPSDRYYRLATEPRYERPARTDEPSLLARRSTPRASAGQNDTDVSE